MCPESSLAEDSKSLYVALRFARGAKAYPALRDSRGDTPLHIAVRQMRHFPPRDRDVRRCELLSLLRPVNVAVPNAAGKLPADEAPWWRWDPRCRALVDPRPAAEHGEPPPQWGHWACMQFDRRARVDEAHVAQLLDMGFPQESVCPALRCLLGHEQPVEAAAGLLAQALHVPSHLWGGRVPLTAADVFHSPPFAP